MFLTSDATPLLEDDIVTCKDPYSKKDVFGLIVLKEVRPGKKYWFIYIPQSQGRKLFFLNEKIAEGCKVAGNYKDDPEHWDIILRGLD